MTGPMDKIFKRISLISKSDNKNILEKCIKIQEEVGELSAELLKLRGKKGSNGIKIPQLKENILEECCDVIIITFSLINALKYNKSRINVAFHKKLDKVALNRKKQKLWKKQIT